MKKKLPKTIGKYRERFTNAPIFTNFKSAQIFLQKNPKIYKSLRISNENRLEKLCIDHFCEK